MCAGIGSSGTLKKVLQGYTGYHRAPQRIAEDEVIHGPPLPRIRGSVFAGACGTGFKRPFELATIRLRNMGQILSHWRTSVLRDDFLTQRGGAFLLDSDDPLLVAHRNQRIP